MTQPTVTIGGNDYPWPEGCKYFEYNTGLDGAFRFLFPDPLAKNKREFPELAEIGVNPDELEWSSAPIRVEHWKPHEIPIIAAVAARHFENVADKIEGEMIDAKQPNFNELSRQRSAAINAACYWGELCASL